MLNVILTTKPRLSNYIKEQLETQLELIKKDESEAAAGPND